MKTLLALSVDRVEKSSTPYQASCEIWKEGFPNILADLLRLLRFVVALTKLPRFWFSDLIIAMPTHHITHITGQASQTICAT